MEKLDFGTNLKKLRNEQGLSQQQLAYKSKISKSAINGYEHCIYGPSMRSREKLAEALGTTVEAMGEPIMLSPGRKKTKSYHTEPTKEVSTEGKIKACFNQVCLLNENCFCESSIVVAGIKGCKNENVVSNKPADKDKTLRVFRNIPGNFMTKGKY